MNPIRNLSIFTAVLCAAAAAQSPLYTLHGTDPEGRFGYVVRNVGDANGDGKSDFGVGAPYTDANGIIDSGMLRTYSGVTGARLREYRGNSEYESSGVAIACAGDVDGDGKADILFADLDARWRYPGEFTVASGGSGRVLLRVFGENAYDYLGASLCEAGDIDLDGYSDYAASEPGNDDNGNHAGRVRVFSGRTKEPIRTFLGSGPNEDFGASLACAGDIDGDGVIDLIIGAPRADLPDRVDCGMVQLFSGRTGVVLFTWYGDAANDRLGCSVNGNGDVDGDGVPDLVAGAYQHDGGGTDAGQVKVFSGRDGSVLHTWLGQTAGDLFGCAVCLGDVDGDGHAEVIAGAPNAFETPTGPIGGVWILSSVDASEVRILEGASAGAHFGFSVDTVDADGDGFAEVLVGAPDDVVQGVAVGSAYVYEFDGSGTAPLITYRGSGCRGTDRMLPRIDVFGRPAIGGTYDTCLRGTIPSTNAVLNIGQQWDLPLAPWAPDCVAYVTLDASLSATTDLQGMARLTPFATIPMDPTLIGFSLHHQWIVLDPGANNALGIAVSNDAVVRIGE